MDLAAFEAASAAMASGGEAERSAGETVLLQVRAEASALEIGKAVLTSSEQATACFQAVLVLRDVVLANWRALRRRAEPRRAARRAAHGPCPRACHRH